MKRTLLSLFSLLAVAFASQAAYTIESVETVSPSVTTDLQSAKVFELAIEGDYFNDADRWTYVHFGAAARPYVTNGTNTYEGSFDKDNNVMGKLTLTLNEEVTTPGTYSLVIPEGALTWGFGTYATFKKENFFTIGNGGETPEPKNYFENAFIGVPEPDSSLEDYDNVLSGVGIILPNFPLEELADADVNVDYSLVTIDGTPVSRYEDEDGVANPVIESFGFESVHVMLNIPFEPYTTPGKFTFAIAPEAITINGVKNPSAFTAEYTIEGGAEETNIFANAVWTPEQGSVNEIKRIDVVFPAVDRETVDAFDDPITIEETVSGIEYHAYAYVDNYTSGYIVVMGDPITTEGEYVIRVPEGAWFCGDMKSPAYELHYTIGELVGAYVIINDAENNVFDIAGRVVLRGADAAAVKSLEPGIYVINGKKVVIRK